MPIKTIMVQAVGLKLDYADVGGSVAVIQAAEHLNASILRARYPMLDAYQVRHVWNGGALRSWVDVPGGVVQYEEPELDA